MYMMLEKGKSPEVLGMEQQVAEWEWGAKPAENSNPVTKFLI